MAARAIFSPARAVAPVKPGPGTFLLVFFAISRGAEGSYSFRTLRYDQIMIDPIIKPIIP